MLCAAGYKAEAKKEPEATKSDLHSPVLHALVIVWVLYVYTCVYVFAIVCTHVHNGRHVDVCMCAHFYVQCLFSGCSALCCSFAFTYTNFWKFQLAKDKNIIEIVNRIKDVVVDEAGKGVARDIIEMAYAL